MQGVCNVCEEFKRELGICPVCRLAVCLDCYSTDHGRCIACTHEARVEQQ